jgi:hypothetical protein
MQRFSVWVIAAVVFGGCATTYYVHPHKTAQELRHDEWDCKNRIGVERMDAGSALAYMMVRGTKDLELCLEAKGWSKEKP